MFRNELTRFLKDAFIAEAVLIRRLKDNNILIFIQLLILFTGFSLAMCHAFRHNTNNNHNKTNNAVPINNNGFR